MDQLIAALPGIHDHIFKVGQTTAGAGTWHSLWAAQGQPPAGANPAAISGVVPTKDTVGAIPFANPVAPALSYLGRAFFASNIAQTLILYDRLWHGGPVSATSTAAQTVNGATVNRGPGIAVPGSAALEPGSVGDDVEVWVEVTTALGATAATLTVSYTNQAGVAGRTATLALPASAIVGRMSPIPLAAGDTGVRSIQSATLSATMGAGAFNLVLVRRVAEISSPVVNAGTVLDAFALGMPRIYNDACIAMMVLAGATTTGNVQAATGIIQG